MFLPQCWGVFKKMVKIVLEFFVNPIHLDNLISWPFQILHNSTTSCTCHSLDMFFNCKVPKNETWMKYTLATDTLPNRVTNAPTSHVHARRSWRVFFPGKRSVYEMKPLLLYKNPGLGTHSKEDLVLFEHGNGRCKGHKAAQMVSESATMCVSFSGFPLETQQRSRICAVDP